MLLLEFASFPPCVVLVEGNSSLLPPITKAKGPAPVSWIPWGAGTCLNLSSGSTNLLRVSAKLLGSGLGSLKQVGIYFTAGEKDHRPGGEISRWEAARQPGHSWDHVTDPSICICLHPSSKDVQTLCYRVPQRMLGSSVLSTVERTRLQRLPARL